MRLQITKFVLVMWISATPLLVATAQAQQPVINFSSSNFEVTERLGSVLISVTRNGDLSNTSTIAYRTDNDGGSSPDCSLFDGFASSRCDYNSAFGTLTFEPGQ